MLGRTNASRATETTAATITWTHRLSPSAAIRQPAPAPTAIISSVKSSVAISAPASNNATISQVSQSWSRNQSMS